jgi:hypothetical protein
MYYSRVAFGEARREARSRFNGRVKPLLINYAST